MLRVAKQFAHAERGVGPLFVDEMGEEDFFDKKQADENRGARSQSEVASYSPVVCRRSSFQEMSVAVARGEIARKFTLAARHSK